MVSRSILLAALSSWSYALVIRNTTIQMCGIDQRANRFASELLWMQRGEDAGFLEPQLKSIEIETYFHVVLPNKGSQKSDSLLYGQLEQQLYTMNQAYAPHSIRFNLQGTETTFNDDWSVDKHHEEMAQALRRGNYSALNVYFLQSLDLGPGVAGYCNLPYEDSANSSWAKDGCTVLVDTLPGGSAIDANFGFVTVHEVGHWFGLLHTFESSLNHGGRCSGPGDTISDTPRQRFPTHGCPVSVDACSNQPNLGPVHNYMDYASGQCQQRFTPGQEKRMYNMFERYRVGR